MAAHGCDISAMPLLIFAARRIRYRLGHHFSRRRRLAAMPIAYAAAAGRAGRFVERFTAPPPADDAGASSCRAIEHFASRAGLRHFATLSQLARADARVDSRSCRRLAAALYTAHIEIIIAFALHRPDRPPRTLGPPRRRRSGVVADMMFGRVDVAAKNIAQHNSRRSSLSAPFSLYLILPRMSRRRDDYLPLGCRNYDDLSPPSRRLLPAQAFVSADFSSRRHAQSVCPARYGARRSALNIAMPSARERVNLLISRGRRANSSARRRRHREVPSDDDSRCRGV